MNQVRTHTRWMTIKEYKKWSNNKNRSIPFNNDKTITRSHIYFV
jgi:hypothetical protein